MSDTNSLSFYEPALTKRSKKKGVKKRVEEENTRKTTEDITTSSTNW